MSMQTIPIPYSPKFEANRDRYGHSGSTDRCLLCGKPVNPARATWVVLTDDLGEIVDPKIEETGEPYGGRFVIGPDCWKSNPQLHPFKVERP